jgi:hypothetical protein
MQENMRIKNYLGLKIKIYWRKYAHMGKKNFASKINKKKREQIK